MGLGTWLKCCGSEKSVHEDEKDLPPPRPTGLSEKSPPSQPKVDAGSKCLDPHVSQADSPDNVEVNDAQDGEPNAKKSLWDRAYDSLDPELVQKYEKLLSAKLQKPSEYL